MRSSLVMVSRWPGRAVTHLISYFRVRAIDRNISARASSFMDALSLSFPFQIWGSLDCTLSRGEGGHDNGHSVALPPDNNFEIGLLCSDHLPFLACCTTSAYSM
jgi:hypothetical protein